LESKINIPKSFFSFLIASFFIWLLINLSKEYTTVVSYSLVYEKLPRNKVFQEKPLNELDIQIKASGFKLLSAKFHNTNVLFYLDKIKQTTDGRYYILPKTQEDIVQKQLYKGLRLDKILKDTVFLKLGELASKKVPVIANVKIDFNHGYDMVSPIKILPDSVFISGPKLQLDKINKIKTKELKLENVLENQEEIIGLELEDEFNKVNLSDNEVKISVVVDKFTEGEFLVPFVIQNLPLGIKIKTFPKQIKVIFKVGLNNFNKITSSSFKVSCDYNVSKANDLPYLIPKLDLKPSLISTVRLMPNKIDFLIQK